MEQVHDIQRQLKNEREENKKLKKRLVTFINIRCNSQKSCLIRVQLLEVDQKRTTTPRRTSDTSGADAVASVQELQAEV